MRLSHAFLNEHGTETDTERVWMPLKSQYLCTPQSRSCGTGQCVNFVVFNSGSAGSGMEIPFKTLRHNWIPEEEKVSS